MVEVARQPAPIDEDLLSIRFVFLVMSSAIYFSGWTMLYPVLPRFVKDELHGGGLAVGLAIGLYGVSSALVRPVWGWVGDRYGRRLLVVMGMACVAATLAAYLVVDSVAAALVVRLAFGVFEGAAFVGLATAAQDLAPDHRRGEAATYLSGSTFVGVAIGPAVGNWVWEQWGYDAVWVTASVLALVGMAFGLATPTGLEQGVIERAAVGQEAPKRALINRTALLPGLVLGCGIIGYAGFVSFIALHVTERHLASPGAVFGTYAALVLVLRVFGAKLPDRYGPLPVAAGGLCLLAVGLWLVAIAQGPGLLFTGIVLFALGVAPIFPGLLSWVVSRAPSRERTNAVATFSAFFDLSMAVGGPVIGLVVALSGEAWGMFVGGAIALLGLPLLVKLGRDDRVRLRRATVPTMAQALAAE